MAHLETVSSVAAKQRWRFLPHTLIYPFRIFKLGKSASGPKAILHTDIPEGHSLDIVSGGSVTMYRTNKSSTHVTCILEYSTCYL